MNSTTPLSDFWFKAKRILLILFNARISLLMVLASYVLCFEVDQVTDSIIGFINFENNFKIVFLSGIGLLWALSLWYWLRCFYFLEYQEASLTKGELLLIEYVPRLLGLASLVIIGLAFQLQYFTVDGRNLPKLLFVGFLFDLYALIFFVGVVIRRRVLTISQAVVHSSTSTERSFLPMNHLSLFSRTILAAVTVVSTVLLIGLTIAPSVSPHLGGVISALFTCLLIWMPALYLITYASHRMRFPFMALLIGVAILFGLINSNKRVRLLEATANQKYSLFDYCDHWYQTRSSHIATPDSLNREDTRIPLTIVLSEGGGIRATYWSAAVLCRLEDKFPGFSKHLFGIQGVSGGSFGAAVYASLLKYHSGERPPDHFFQTKATEIIGKDYLSPLLTSVLTRGVLQLFIPVPIDCFDPAKVFELTWEHKWKNVMATGDTTFSSAFTSLWDTHDSLRTIPSLFIHTTRVENGYPFVISNVKLPFASTDAAVGSGTTMGITGNFYTKTAYHDIRLSTAALLSARFPYITPAGILAFDTDSTAGFVDGGYYDNTGANLTLNIFMCIKSHIDKKVHPAVPLEDSAIMTLPSSFRKKIKPVVIYLKNGHVFKDVKTSGKSLLYQLTAPTNTIFQVRDAFTDNSLDKLHDFITMYDGEFITLSLQDDGDTTVYPLGWTLSKTAQLKIDNRVSELMDSGSGERLLRIVQ